MLALTGSRDGGFRLLEDGGREIEVRPEAGGWSIGGTTPLSGLVLSRSDVENGGFVLAVTGPPDTDPGRGHSFRSEPGEAPGPSRQLLLDDGSAWRMVLRGPRSARWELAGWETTGPYVVVRPGAKPDAWTVEPTAAGRALPRLDELLVLMAAEIVLADDDDDGAA